jgi:hypothetical protein
LEAPARAEFRRLATLRERGGGSAGKHGKSEWVGI